MIKKKDSEQVMNYIRFGTCSVSPKKNILMKKGFRTSYELQEIGKWINLK